MLLVRRLGCKEHALAINSGLVGCRDVASTLTKQDNSTGYANSNYQERLFMKNRFGIGNYVQGLEQLSSAWARLIRILLDGYIAETYLTYFHIVESRESLRWLEEECGDGGYFIYYVPHFEVKESVGGEGYCGQRVIYVDSAEDIDSRRTLIENPNLSALLDNELVGFVQHDEAKKYVKKFLDSTVPLFNRIKEGRFDERENEYRILVRSPRETRDGITKVQVSNPYMVACDGGRYEIKRIDGPANGEVGFEFLGMNGDTYDLFDMVSKSQTPELISTFKDIDIRDSAERYGYIGDKTACAHFIEAELAGSDEFIRDDESNHLFHGDWSKCRRLEFKKVDDEEEYVGIIRPPEAGYYRYFGPGFREAFLPNPKELGLLTPEDSFTSALSYLVNDFKADQPWEHPLEYYRELLCNSLSPWTPMKLYRAVDSSALRKEIEYATSGFLPFSSFLEQASAYMDYARIRQRMSKSVTLENMKRTINQYLERDNLIINRQQFKSFSKILIDNFDSWRNVAIDGCIESLQKDVTSFGETVHVVQFHSFNEDKIIAHLSEGYTVFEYEIDPYDLMCSCSRRSCCGKRAPITLCYADDTVTLDLSELSFVFSGSPCPEDVPLGAVYLAVVGLASQQTCCTGHWILALQCCSNLSSGEGLAAKIRPTRIVMGSEVEIGELQSLQTSGIGVDRL